MGSERGQATVEWTGLLLLVALALVALGHLASKADGQELGPTLAEAVTHPGTPADAARARPAPGPPRSTLPGGTRPALPGGTRSPLPGARPALPSVGRADVLGAFRRADGALQRAGRGAGALWRRAWFACLVYERFRYAMRHPESRRPEYTFPYDVALRIVNGCAVPVDLLGDLPELNPGP